MPRSPANNTLAPLLRRLAGKLGERQAASELRWLAEHVRKVIGSGGEGDHHHHHHGILDRHHRQARLWREQPAVSAGEVEQEARRFTPVQWAWLRQAVSDRVEQHKPLQYILGNQPFGKASIATRPPVLIPRWETEEWMMRLAEMLKSRREALLAERDQSRRAGADRPLNILDACTGSGCLAVGLACELAPGAARIAAVDVSADAVALAEANVVRNAHAMHNPVAVHRLDLQAGDAAARLLGAMAEGSGGGGGGSGGGGWWDMIVSNPPYVTPADYAELDPDVRDWEDRRALVPAAADGQPDPEGVSFVVRLAALARDLGLATPARCPTDLPRLVVEIGGPKQTDPARQAMHDCGFALTEVWKDMAGVERVVLGYAKD
ncbi:hypothetical protein H4R18_003101 [Coemansia javaensis]|uniref:S-adenosyl-L-methionine-dependent methyltransferase n=1 Tax=Coemansia javaensis TaxID=2761396 RepID=A0A9W8LIX9_9FUNG|nr:hypothetical protein H4R18_003101 [Coemansia javaensis]